LGREKSALEYQLIIMKIKNPKEYALYLLKFKDRSERGIEQKMKQKDFSDQEIAETISFLLERKFVDEKKLAQMIIRDGLELKLWGRYRIQKKLIREQIKREIVDSSLTQISYEDELKSAKLAKKKWLKKNRIKNYEDKQKLFGFLGRKGFGWEIILELDI